MDGYVASHMVKQDKPSVAMKLKHKINNVESSHLNSQLRNNTLIENNGGLLQVTTINSTIRIFTFCRHQLCPVMKSEQTRP